MGFVTKFDIDDDLLPRLNLTKLTSKYAAPGDTIKWSGLFEKGLPVHAFIGAQFRDAQNQFVTPTGGSIAIHVQTINSYPKWEILGTDLLEDSTIDAQNAETLSWNGNVQGLMAEPTGLLGLAKWQIIVTCNRH